MKREKEEGVVKEKAKGELIRGREKRLKIGISKEKDQILRLELIGNEEDLLDYGRLSWLLEREIEEERKNGGEKKVEGERYIVAVSLTVIEKGSDQRCIEVPQVS